METIGAVLNSPVNAYPPCIQGEVLLRFTDLNFKEEQKKVLHASHVVTLESERLYMGDAEYLAAFHHVLMPIAYDVGVYHTHTFPPTYTTHPHTCTHVVYMHAV